MGISKALVQRLDYGFYRLDQSRNIFRGPKPDLSGDYLAFLGSTEIFGKYLPCPLTHLVQDQLQMPCANFSNVNAGLDLVSRDPAVQLACSGARVTIIAVMGAHNMSNRMYRVHPRRNDRFLDAAPLVRHLAPKLDVTGFHYTRHFLTSLRQVDEGAFRVVVSELKKAWVARMKTVIEQIRTPSVLFWLADQPPPEAGGAGWTTTLGPEPLFVDQSMVDQISPLVTQVIECVVSQASLNGGRKGMIYDKSEEAIVQKMPGPAYHQEAAKALLGPLKKLVSA